MPKLNRRKPFAYKQDKVIKPPKTSRREMSAVQRAFVVGAIVASRDGYRGDGRNDPIGGTIGEHQNGPPTSVNKITTIQSLQLDENEGGD
jgi:hypothetical protein